MAKRKDLAAYEIKGAFIPTAGIWQGDVNGQGKDPRCYEAGPRDSPIPRLAWGEHLTPEEASRLMNPVLMQGTTKSHKIPKDLAAIADMMELHNPIITEKMKQFIESLEPNCHQFFEVDINSAHTNEPVYTTTKWYYWNIMHWIAPDLIFDTSHAVRPDFDVKFPDGRRSIKYDHSAFRSQQIIMRNAHVHIKNIMFWKSSTYTRDNTRHSNSTLKIYCAPQVKAAAKTAGLKELHFREIEWAQ